MNGRAARWLALATVPVLGLAAGCDRGGDGEVHPDLPPDVLERLLALSPGELPAPPPDVTNAWADDPAAAVLGQQLFFDTRFSGPLLDEDNDGAPGTLGVAGETGRVSCESCHNAGSGFLDTRSPRGQISLAAGWTRRRSPSLLDVGQATILTWDGRRDALYNQVFGVIESPLEFNSTRLFVAQQIARYYAAPYEALFGPLPAALADFAEVEPAQAGCATLPEDLTTRCPGEGHDDPAVIEVLVNMGKALGAYERRLSCGPSRFDAWMHGDLEALSEDEQAGAVLFVQVGCDSCHAGPFFTDQQFYNVGAANLQNNFVEPFDDPGAVVGLADNLADPLNSRGPHSDGDDGRLDAIPADTSALQGAFRTPALRCLDRRPSFFHAAQKRSLEDVVRFFDRGGDSFGYQGDKDPSMVPLGLEDEELAQLTAFLRALAGPGPDAELIQAPVLPE